MSICGRWIRAGGLRRWTLLSGRTASTKSSAATATAPTTFPDDVPAYKSIYSLDKVYPNSSASFASSSTTRKDDGSTENFSGHIPIDKLRISYARSGKPGGQHVNKTNTKVTVALHLASADWIPSAARQKLAELHKNNISKDGFWAVKSEKTRAQTLNLADCLDKLRCYITEAALPPPQVSQETLEERQRLAEKAAAERLRQKRIRSMIKSGKKASLD